MGKPIGKSIGRYHILEQLGQGGMAIVYKAYDTRLEREVAIKLIRKDAFPVEVHDRVLQRFDREAKALAKLSHPNIVKVHDYGEYEGAPYLVMELIDGGALKAYIGQPMPYQNAVHILLPIARALAYAHERKILHRDIKPGNILISQSGEPILTDFGIAKLLESGGTQTLTGTGLGVGTPEYMAPEQGLGKEVDGRADIYSLGIVLYELLTGKKPYQADTPLAVLLKQVNDPIPNPRQEIKDLPDEVEKILIKAMAKDSQNRYQNMNEFVSALNQLTKNFVQNGNELWLTKKEALLQLPPGKEMVFSYHEEKTRDNIGPIVKPGLHKNEQRFTKWMKWISICAFMVILLSGMIMIIVKMIPKSNDVYVEDDIQKTNDTSETILQFESIQTRDKDGMVQVFVPAGEFKMGSENGNSTERPIHTVDLDAFWIDQTEITNAMYYQCVINGVCTMPDKLGSYSRNNYFDDPTYADYPVIYVNWEQAKTYCEWVGGRLPSEAEWEKAARGMDSNAYPWGNNLPDATFTNYNGNIGDTTKAGSFPTDMSTYGVYDMAGNVKEWVADWYGENYYEQSPLKNPIGPKVGNTRVLRGGSWIVTWENLRSAFRDKYNPMNTNIVIGFRCATSQ